jgi:hypothetical protein
MASASAEMAARFPIGALDSPALSGFPTHPSSTRAFRVWTHDVYFKMVVVVRILLSMILVTFAFPVAANEVKKERWECVFPDPELKEVVEAPDQKTADALCREIWEQDKNAARRKKWKVNEGVTDDVFSKRTLLR